MAGSEILAWYFHAHGHKRRYEACPFDAAGAPVGAGRLDPLDPEVVGKLHVKEICLRVFPPTLLWAD